MDALSPSSSYEKVVFMKGAQIGGTEAGNNWIGYIIDQAPGPMLVVQPTVEMGKRWSKGRLAPLIEDTICLHGKVKDPRSRDSGNTVQSKEFPGGQVVITGANSAVGLRSMPVRYLFLDEVDAYPPDARNRDVAAFRNEQEAPQGEQADRFFVYDVGERTRRGNPSEPDGRTRHAHPYR